MRRILRSTQVVPAIAMIFLASCAHHMAPRPAKRKSQKLCNASGSKVVIDFKAVNSWLACKGAPAKETKECNNTKTLGGNIARASWTTFGAEPPAAVQSATVASVAALIEGMKAWPDVSREVLQLLPASVMGCVPVFVVGNGHPWGDAYVRKVQWHDKDIVLSASHGEPAVLLNASVIASTYPGGPSIQAQSVLGVLKHEVFHVFFERYRSEAPQWQQYQSTDPLNELALLVLNEGIAHFADQKETLLREGIPRERAEHALNLLKTAVEKLSAAGRNSKEAIRLLQAASQGRYWDKYGSISGMVFSYGIFQVLGERGLQEAVRCGPGRFLQLYEQSTRKRSDLPKLPTGIGPLRRLDFCS